jgi:hypothetical protein
VQYFIRSTDSADTQSLPNLSNLWIDLARVLLNHPVAIVLRRKRLNSAFHHRYPGARNSISIAVIIKRHHFQLEGAIKRLRIERIDLRDLRAIVTVPDRKTIRAVIPFEPPAIEYGEIQSTIDRDFLAARP